MSTEGMAMTHSLVSINAWKEWFHEPVTNPSFGVKSITSVHEIVMIFFLRPIAVVTSVTGPGSINMKAFVIGNSFMCLFPFREVRARLPS